MGNGLFLFSNLHRCYLKCRARKRNTANALRFELNLEENLCRLERELVSKSYQPARSVCFAVKKPKLREIFAADFRDRIAHHILVDHLEKIFEPRFIYDSWACRAGKGTHGAVERLREFARRVTANGSRPAFYLQLDLKSFFVSIDKTRLLEMIRRRTADPDALWLADKIINNDCARNFVIKGSPALIRLIPPHKTLFKAPPGRGLPIGNLTSQFFANVYLNELDQFVKRDLKVRFYIRYVDDFILLSRDREELAAWKEKIGGFLLERLGLELHPLKQRLNPVSNGIDFLGYIVRPGYMLVRRRVVAAFKRKMDAVGALIRRGGSLDSQASLVLKTGAVAASYAAHFNYAASRGLRSALEKRYPFLAEFKRVARLNVARPFSCLAAQYEAFTNAVAGLNTGWDAHGQGYFTARPALVFFPAGKYYVFYGLDAGRTAAELGLRYFLNARLPPSVNARWGGGFCHFPRALENKYAALASAKGYTVYIAREDKSVVFDHKLVSRVFAGYVPAGGGLCVKTA